MNQYLQNAAFPLSRLLGQAVDARETLSTAGLLIMVVSVCSVLSLIGFCLYRVLTLPPVDDPDDEDRPPRSLSM